MSAYSNNHILYGNYGLSNKRVQIKELDFLNSSPVDLQTIPISRGSGASVVRTRNESRSIKMLGGVTKTNDTQDDDSILYMTSELNRIFNYQDRYLRTVPKSKMTIIDDCQNASGWFNSDDAVNITLDTKNFQWKQASVNFLVDVSASSNNYATMTKTLANPINLNSVSDSGNFEIWLDIEDIYYVTSVELRLGNDSDNYYSKTFTTNYEGNKLENGTNYFSVDWGNEVQGKTILEVGAVDDSAIDYEMIRINYSSSAEDFYVNIGGIFHVQEQFVRNYPCYSKGGVSWNPSWFIQTDNLANYFEVDLLNYTGYGIATHSIQLFNELGITSVNQTKTINLKGNLQPRLDNIFILNSVINLVDLRFSNLNNNETIRWNNSWMAGDIVRFDKLNTVVTKNGSPQDFEGKLPNAVLGINRLSCAVVQSSDTVVSYLSGNTYRDCNRKPPAGGVGFPAMTKYTQSFVTPSSGTNTLSLVKLRGYGLYNYGDVNISIETDSSNSPSGTSIWSGNFTPSSTTNFALDQVAPNISISNSTKYWIVLSPAGFAISEIYRWGISDTSYDSGEAKNQFASGPSYTATSDDQQFEVTFAAAPSTNMDWQCNYKPLYL